MILNELLKEIKLTNQYEIIKEKFPGKKILFDPVKNNDDLLNPETPLRANQVGLFCVLGGSFDARQYLKKCKPELKPIGVLLKNESISLNVYRKDYLEKFAEENNFDCQYFEDHEEAEKGFIAISVKKEKHNNKSDGKEAVIKEENKSKAPPEKKSKKVTKSSKSKK